jgi:integrase
VNKQTVEQAGIAFIEGAKAGRIHSRGRKPYKPSVLRSYETSLRLHAYPEIGDARLTELTIPDLQGWVNQMVADGVNASTIRNTINPVRAIYGYALSVGDAVVNPTTGLKLPAVGGARTRVATPVEAEELLAPLTDDDAAIYATAFYAGLRRGELRGLRAEDVEAGIIHVRRGWDDVEGEIDPKSSAGKRKVPVPAILSKRLAAYAMATGRRGDDLLFGRTAADPFDPGSLYDRAAKAWEAENEKRKQKKRPTLSPILLHECRHTYVSLMFAAGTTLEEIGEYVGHSSSYMTDKYRHLLPGSHDEARKRMDKLLAGRL